MTGKRKRYSAEFEAKVALDAWARERLYANTSQYGRP
jgi:hypothetical protein